MKARGTFLVLLMSLFAMSVTSCINDELTDSQEPGAGKILSVAEQVAAIEATMSDIESLQAALGEMSDADLEAAASALESHVADLKSGVSLIDATMATLEQQRKLASVTGAIAAADEEGDLDKCLANLEKGVKAWLGKTFTEYYPAAFAEAQASARLSGLDIRSQKINIEGILSDVEAGLRKTSDPEELKTLAAAVTNNADEAEKILAVLAELTDEVAIEYEKAVAAAINEPENFDAPAVKSVNRAVAATIAEAADDLASLASRVAACEAQLASIQERLGDLETEIGNLGALLNMIQSVTFMSEYSEENVIAYYSLGNDVVTDDGKKRRIPAESITLNYLVRPAAAAQAFKDQNLWNQDLKVIGYYAEAITKAANLRDFTITNVTADNTSGLVSVTVENTLDDNFYFKNTGAKMALSLVTGKTDLTSKFVEVVPKDQSKIVYLESLAFESEYIEIDDGQSKQLVVKIFPENVTDRKLIWTTSNINRVAVSETGKIDALEVGEEVITVTSNSTDEWGRKLTAACKVKVNPNVKLIGPGYVEDGGTIELKIESPEYIDPQYIRWTSSSPDFAAVDQEGNVTGVLPYYDNTSKEYVPIQITCTIYDGLITLNHDVRVVYPQPKQIKINGLEDNVNEYTFKKGKSFQISPSLVPIVLNNSNQYHLVYSSTAEGVAKVDPRSGLVSALAPGEATIIARLTPSGFNYYYPSGNELQRRIKFIVEPYWVESITLPQTMTLAPKATATLTPTFTSDVEGEQPTNTNLIWTSSNSSIVSIDEDGEMTAHSEGTVEITATTASGAAANSAIKTATCMVTVKAPVADVKIGDYYYSDGTWGSSPNPTGKTVIGVIFSNANAVAADPQLLKDFPNCSNGLAVGLVEYSNLDFGAVSNQYGHKYYTELRFDANLIVDQEKTVGYGNTRAHIALNKSNSTYCSMFNSATDIGKVVETQGSSKSSKWYVPSFKEMQLLNENRTSVNASLAEVGGTSLAEPQSDDNIKTDFYWSSTIRGQWYSSGGTWDHLKHPFDIYKNDWTTFQQSSGSFLVRVILAF